MSNARTLHDIKSGATHERLSSLWLSSTTQPWGKAVLYGEVICIGNGGWSPSGAELLQGRHTGRKRYGERDGNQRVSRREVGNRRNDVSNRKKLPHLSELDQTCTESNAIHFPISLDVKYPEAFKVEQQPRMDVKDVQAWVHGALPLPEKVY